MFALLAPAGFALVVSVKKRLDAHAQYAAVQRRAKQAADLRGAAAGALPDAEVELWRERAALATERIKGLETVITVRFAAGTRRQDGQWLLSERLLSTNVPGDRLPARRRPVARCRSTWAR